MRDIPIFTKGLLLASSLPCPLDPSYDSKSLLDDPSYDSNSLSDDKTLRGIFLVDIFSSNSDSSKCNCFLLRLFFFFPVIK